MVFPVIDSLTHQIDELLGPESPDVLLPPLIVTTAQLLGELHEGCTIDQVRRLRHWMRSHEYGTLARSIIRRKQLRIIRRRTEQGLYR